VPNPYLSDILTFAIQPAAFGRPAVSFKGV
jgi:hypothetical protein